LSVFKENNREDCQYSRKIGDNIVFKENSRKDSQYARRLNESVVFMIYKMALYPTKKLDYTIIVTVCRDYDIKVEH